MSLGVFLRRILTLLGPYRVRSIVILIGLLLEMGFNGCLPLGFKFLIDQAIVPGNQQVLAEVVGLLVGGAVLAACIGLGNDYLSVQVRTALLRDLRWQMFRHLQRLSIGFYARTEAGNILARFSTDLAAVENAIIAAIPWAILPGLNVLFSAVLLFPSPSLGQRYLRRVPLPPAMSASSTKPR
jgi:ATP-binding cassette, subfamily B, bacterial